MVDFSYTVIHIPYVSLDCNLMQLCIACGQQFTQQAFSSTNSAGKGGRQRCLGEVAEREHLLYEGCKLQKTNMATYRMQKIAGSWIVDGVFRSYGMLRIFDVSPDCVRTTHDIPGSVFRVNRGQQEARLNPC